MYSVETQSRKSRHFIHIIVSEVSLKYFTRTFYENYLQSSERTRLYSQEKNNQDVNLKIERIHGYISFGEMSSVIVDSD